MVTCPVCSTVAKPGDKFCSNCGTDLSGTAADTETQDDLSRYLPEELLAKMRSARAGHAMAGERRTVTMLFADIQGSTSAAEQLDPEDWAEIMNGAFEHLIAPIYRYEGTLAQLRGDAVLAFFGAPIAHEDDPTRALRAGLEIVEAIEGYSSEVNSTWGIPIKVRVGVNTGLVVVGEMGSDLRVEYTALGDAINVAARMEQTAEPGTVRVTGRTLSLTGGAFEAEELGPVEVKGKAEPVVSYRVLRYTGETGTTTEELPIVGRESELEALQGMRSRLVGGTGSITSIIAEAGVGKSRLLREFWTRSSQTTDVVYGYDQDGEISWMSVSSHSYDSGNPFATIRDLLRGWWHLDGTDSGFAAIEAATANAGIDDADTAALLGYIGGTALSEEAESFIRALQTPVLHAKAAEALSDYLAALAASRPLLIVLEDLHWADDLSLALIENALDLTERVPIGLIVTMRPYREEPTWRIHEVAARDHHHRYLHLDLSPLGTEESTTLLESLLRDTSLPADTRQRILERSEGNPLYLEEMIRSVNEVGAGRADEVTLPTSLSGMLTARLDRLEDESRYVVQVASVLGSEFDREMLAVLFDDSPPDTQLTDLLRRGILVEMPGRPGALGFRHALIQEAAYETILRRTRRDLHRRVADHLIDTDPDAAPDIARHLVEAGDMEDAFPYLIEAGVRASRSMALADAIRLLKTAVENPPVHADPELVERAHDGLGEAYALVPDLSQAAAAYQRLYEYGETEDRPSTRVTALNRLAYATASIGADLAGAAAYLDDARRLAEETGDEVGLAEYHMNACFVASLAGHVGEAVNHDEATVELGEKSGVDSIRLSGLVRRAINYTALLDFDRGRPAVETALAEAKAAGLEEAIAIIEAFGTATEHLMRGDLRRALEVADQAQVTLERYSSFYVGMNQRNIAMVLYELGDLEDALGRYAEGRRIAERVSQPFVITAIASGMALIYATAGMTGQIPPLREEIEDRLDGRLGEFLASTALADLGWVDILLDSPAEAVDAFRHGLGVSSTTQFIERPRLLIGLAKAQMMQGDLSEAESALTEARALVDEKGLGIYEALLAWVEGEALARKESYDEASQKLVDAQQTAMDTGQRLTLVEILRTRALVAQRTDNEQEAANHLESASDAIHAIADSIADETLKDSFTVKWEAGLTQEPAP